MRPVTQRFLDSIRGSHAMRARARVIPAGLSGLNPGTLDSKGNPVNEIPIFSGDVKLDSTADVRGTLDMETTYAWPTSASGLLTPYGNEIYIERGVVFGDGVVEWVSQGYFRIYSVDQADAPDGPIQIGARDRMSGIIDFKPLAPRQFLAGTTVDAAFTALVGEVYPSAIIIYDFDATVTPFTSNHVMDSDRYAFLKDIVDSLGKVMYWDYQGRLQVKTAPNPANSVFTINHGKGGVMVNMSRSLDRADVFNAVVAKGEAPGEQQPVRAVAYDFNPKSPTYWDGPFGKVPTELTSSFITTTEQAQTAAQAKLDRSISVPYSVDFSLIPNPALEPLDPVLVSYTGKRPSETHVIQSLTVPLTAQEAMTGTTRQR